MNFLSDIMDYHQYRQSPDPDKRTKYAYWQAAKGLQAVDGLETSPYLDQVAGKNIEGDITAYQARELIDSYYEIKDDRDAERQYEEADKVSARINMLISEGGFTLSSDELKTIHQRLFEGVFDHAGQYRKNNIIKYEWVLDGDTVTYGNAYNLDTCVDNLLRQESLTQYRQLNEEEAVWHIARFISSLWVLHPFSEGNTRTTAVFLIKYLRKMGFDINNSAFEKNSRYFRDALVRANYTNIKKKVYADNDPLDRFFSNLLLGTNYELKSRYLHIKAEASAVKAQLDTSSIDDTIELMISENPQVSRKEIADACGVHVKTIERHLAAMPHIRYVGPAKTGHWEINNLG